MPDTIYYDGHCGLCHGFVKFVLTHDIEQRFRFAPLDKLSAAERHLERLRQGRQDTIETTSLHLDVLRDLKRIHSHICTAAYPVLEAAGEIHSRSRLRDETTAAIEPVAGQAPVAGTRGD